MSEWKLLAEEKPELWTNALCWRSDWDKPDWLMWKENNRIIKAIACGEDVEGMVPIYFGDLVEYDDYDLAKPDNFPTHWMIPRLPGEPDPLKTAVLTIIKSVQSYLPPDSGVSKDQFISEVIGAVDNPEVYAALHGTSDAGNDSLKRALERGE